MDLSNVLVCDEFNPGRLPCLLKPTRQPTAIDLDYDALADKIDLYFDHKAKQDKPPLLTEFLLAVGFSSFNQLLNHARRKGGPTMRAISSALLAIGVEYEQRLMDGSRTASWMLERLPGFDEVEPASQTPAMPFQVKQEMNLNIQGVLDAKTIGQHLTGQQAYLEMIKHKTFEEIERVREMKKNDDDVYEVVEIPDE